MISQFVQACTVAGFAFVVLILLFANQTAIVMEREAFTPTPDGLHLAGPSKCFSCERELPPHLKWQGRQTKCFDCERQLASKDPALANFTHGTKCFSCERDLSDGATPLMPPPPVLPFTAATGQRCMDAGSGQCLHR